MIKRISVPLLLLIASGLLLSCSYAGKAGTASPYGMEKTASLRSIEPFSEIAFTGSEDFSSVLSDSVESGAFNDYDSFNILTCLRKLGDRWFLVDCYHDQILYADDPKTPVEEWRVMTRAITRGHTLDWDGEFYLTDDTNNNRVLVFTETDGKFEVIGQFSQIGVLPHFVVYDKTSRRFYVLSSLTGELYVFANTAVLEEEKGISEASLSRESSEHEIVLERILRVSELDASYVRSFTIDAGNVYFVSGNGNVILAELPEAKAPGNSKSQKNRGEQELKILKRYPVADDIAGMVQLAKIGSYYYITVSTNRDFDQSYATFLRTKDLNSLKDCHKTASSDKDSACEDIYSCFIGGGTPYFIGSDDGHFYLTEHRLAGHALWQFDVEEDEIINIEAIQ